MNKILMVDLTSESFKTQPLDEKVIQLLLGGKGRYLVALQIDKAWYRSSISRKPLIFSLGPLNGTIAPCTKLCIVFKSPATGTIDDSYCGGPLGAEIKFAGYDAIVITGKADKPSLLLIDEDKVEVRNAENLWGATTFETESRLKKELGEEFKIAEIGPAGERKAPIASIFSNWRCAGRGGLGAVMGSKNLKAIAVRGKKPVTVYDPIKFEKMVWIALRTLRMGEVTVRSLPIYGTANILLTINETEALPTKNFQTGRFKAYMGRFSSTIEANRVNW
jgi:aldehyde:ferredoxin oxidoreductase